MDTMLANKVCAVTGGSRGIGLAIVKLFASQGARVYYLSRSQAADSAALESAARLASGLVTWIACDAADDGAVTAAIDGIAAKEGALDILVNNAGITRDGLLMRMSTEAWDEVIRTNLGSAFFASRVAARHMIKRRSGCILNMASVVGITGNGGQSNYAASKAGIIGFTKSLARELCSRNVRVNAIAPGFIETAMTDSIPGQAREKLLSSIPLGRVGKPQDIAQAALFLCSDSAAYITGEVLKVDGGMAI